MATVHVRNVPEDIYARIKNLAEKKNHSISAEVVILLELGLAEAEQPQTTILNDIRRRRFFSPAAANAPSSLELLHEDRER